MRLLIAALSGALFGAGLLLSGMTDPAKVQGFLDISGAWNPVLAFVLGGALIPMAIAWRIAARRKTALCGADLPGPASTRIDGRLITGSALFGIGWGWAGLCPGPALAQIAFPGGPTLIFVAAMLAGMVAVRFLPRP